EYTRLHSLLSDSYVARYGFINQPALIKVFERTRNGDKRVGEIFRIIALEFWLRSLDQHRPTAESNVAVVGSPEACPTAA
ncbi:MAG TPA: hypothetical protein VFD75_11145, partial [Pyrinomonadaceae bacterium]|nr:hypothetical protein [Pyrinomonadaceae bacterium]